MPCRVTHWWHCEDAIVQLGIVGEAERAPAFAVLQKVPVLWCGWAGLPFLSKHGSLTLHDTGRAPSISACARPGYFERKGVG